MYVCVVLQPSCVWCQVDAARFDALLADPGKVDCPLLSALGYPVILVSTTPRRQCIPVVSQDILVGLE